MSGRFRGLLRHTVVYGLGGMAQRFIGFILIPLYTRYLTPADYGILALAGLLLVAFQQVQLLGMPSAMTRSYILLKAGREDQDRVVGTGAWSILCQAALLGVALALGARPTARAVFGSEEHVAFVWLVALSAPFYAVESLRNTLFRIREQSRQYALVSFISFLISLLVTLVLVVGLGWGAMGVLVGQVAASVLMAILFLPWLIRSLALGFNSHHFRDMMSYGLPLVPAGLATWALDLMDRYFLRLYRPLEEVGLYSLGYRFGMILMLLLMAFRLAWPQVMFHQARGDEGAAKEFFSRCLTYYVMGMAFAVLGVAALSGDALRLLTPPAYHAAAGVIPLIALAYAVQGSFIILQVGIDVRRRTGLIPLFTGMAALLNLILNWLLIPAHGMYGAALATLCAFLVVPTAYYLVNQRLYPIVFQWGRILGIALMAGALYAASVMIQSRSAMLDAGARIFLVLAFLPLLWASPLVSGEDRRRLRAWLRPSITST